MNYINEKLDKFNRYISNKKIAILGVGVSNIPLLDYFHEYGAIVTIFDYRQVDKIDEIAISKIEDYRYEYHFGEDCLKYLKGFDMIFRSPSGMPFIKEIKEEVDRGAILTTEIEMLLKLSPATFIGITGSDGKTTTTSLIYEILKCGGYNCFLGGNIGIPLFTKVKDMRPEDIVVLELSSFQLIDMKISPKISVITNISPNHLNVHSSYEEYIQSKENIYKYQNDDGIIVLNYDNMITKNFSKNINNKYIMFSSKTKLEDGIIYDDGIIKECKDGVRKHILNVKDINLRGIHNFENVCAAIAATNSLVDTQTQVKAIKNFKGVEHRLELVREINGVKWYNDSIGTSPTRTIAGLNSFDENIILIAGGYDKHLDYSPIGKPIVDNVGTLILMGATADKIENSVKEELKKDKKDLSIYKCDTLEQTVNLAFDIAKKGDVVLFSPASASFDLFKNFAERGEKFKAFVNNL